MDLSPYIDHTNLRPDVTKNDIERLVAEAALHHFASVCIPPFWVELAAGLTKGTGVKVGTVAGFPLGFDTPFALMASISESLKSGAEEIDLVMNISAFKSGLYQRVIEEIEMVANTAHSLGGIVKVIIETAYLDDEEVRTACNICERAGADYVKTSTGFASKGAELGTVRIMKQTLNGHLKIKASGGIKTTDQALAFIEAGAARIGTSSGLKIIGKE